MAINHCVNCAIDRSPSVIIFSQARTIRAKEDNIGLSKEETNGYLKAIERQVADLNNAMSILDSSACLNDKAFEIFRKAKIDILNAGQKFLEVRGWNQTDK